MDSRTNLDVSSYNVLDTFYHLEMSIIAVNPSVRKPPSDHVFGQFLLNAWRKRNVKLDKVQKKLTNAKVKCNAAMEGCAKAEEDVKKAESENQVISTTLNVRLNELSIVQEIDKSLLELLYNMAKTTDKMFEKTKKRQQSIKNARNNIQRMQCEIVSLNKESENIKSENVKMLGNMRVAVIESNIVDENLIRHARKVRNDLIRKKEEIERTENHLHQEMQLITKIENETWTTLEQMKNCESFSKELDPIKQRMQEALQQYILQNQELPQLFLWLLDVGAGAKEFVMRVFKLKGKK